MTNLIKSHAKKLHIVKELTLIRVNVRYGLHLPDTQALGVSPMKRGKSGSVLGLFAPTTLYNSIFQFLRSELFCPVSDDVFIYGTFSILDYSLDS